MKKFIVAVSMVLLFLTSTSAYADGYGRRGGSGWGLPLVGGLIAGGLLYEATRPAYVASPYGYPVAPYGYVYQQINVWDGYCGCYRIQYNLIPVR